MLMRDASILHRILCQTMNILTCCMPETDTTKGSSSSGVWIGMSTHTYIVLLRECKMWEVVVVRLCGDCIRVNGIIIYWENWVICHRSERISNRLRCLRLVCHVFAERRHRTRFGIVRTATKFNSIFTAVVAVKLRHVMLGENDKSIVGPHKCVMFHAL